MIIQSKIVIIDDEPKHLKSFIDNLCLEYGKDNIILHENAREGLQYILTHKGLQKMVLILDYSLAKGDISCMDVFEEVTKSTALVSIIIMTNNGATDIGIDNLKKFINHHAYYLITNQSHESLKDKLEIVRKAVDSMNKRVDTALEQWILMHEAKEREIPYITTKAGKTYSLNELLVTIRKQEPEGIDLERKILNLAIGLLTRKEEEI